MTCWILNSAPNKKCCETARDVLERHCPLSVVRELEDDAVGYPSELWGQLGKLDLIGLLLPESAGGSDMSLVEGVALYEELGRALAPVPHFVSAVLSGWVLARGGSQEHQESWLPKLASGEAIFTPAWLEPDGGFSALGVATTATKGPDGFVLTGTKRHVAFARAADRLVVLARTGEGAEEVDLFLVDPQSPGVTMTQQFTLGSDTQYQVELNNVLVPEADRVGAPGTGWSLWEEVMRDGVVLLGAQAVGGARYALDITVQYAKDRHQFDKPLGAFQALAHYLADAVTTVDGAEQLVHEAAWAGPTADRWSAWHRWPNCTPARPSGMLRPWPSRSLAASASRWNSISSSTSGGPSSSRSAGGTRGRSNNAWQRPCLTDHRWGLSSVSTGRRSPPWPPPWPPSFWPSPPSRRFVRPTEPLGPLNARSWPAPNRCSWCRARPTRR